MQHALKIIYEQLPVYAETGTDTQTLDIARLEQIICDQTQESKETATKVIHLVERLFVSCALLHEELLNNTPKQWQFVSCPAFLFAKSLLQTWIDPDHAWFEPHFWKYESAREDKQREVLRQFELQRKINHKKSGQYNPIRYVHVAWAFIKLDGELLFYHREDRKRPGHPSFVPIGGKLDLRDFDNDVRHLTEIHQPKPSEAIYKALEKTLVREIQEESGLLIEEDCTYQPLADDLAPFRHIEGTGAKHANAEYRFRCFSIKLTRLGLFNLHLCTRQKLEFPI